MREAELIGQSAGMRRVKQQLGEVADSELTVLLQGETGTGKGVAAQLVHQWSRRRDGPLVPVNCGALQEGLVDSELFGHERGAFTGAIARKLGTCELAHTGTLFLDEIGDLPLASQTRLLRVLQDRCIERVGGTRTIPLDVRVVAATHRDLAQAVQEGSFRQDLYYRLRVFPVWIPPLRARREDIPLLARHFVGQFAAQQKQAPPGISAASLAGLQEYDWPGNVRELEHVLQRAVVLARRGEIGPEHLEVEPVGESVGTAAEGLQEGFAIVPLEEYERRYLVRVLAHTNGVIHGDKGAALLLGMKPTTLRSRLEKLGVLKTRRSWTVQVPAGSAVSPRS